MTTPVDLRALLDPLARVKAARPQVTTHPATYLPPPDPRTAGPEVAGAAPVPVPSRTDIGPMSADLPAELLSNGEPDLRKLLGLALAAIGQIQDQYLVSATATVTPPAMTAANADVDVTVTWDAGTAQTMPVVTSVVPVGPGPLQQRALTATVVSRTTSGVTVRFRTKRALIGALALDPEDRYVVNAVHLFTPPFAG